MGRSLGPYKRESFSDCTHRRTQEDNTSNLCLGCGSEERNGWKKILSNRLLQRKQGLVGGDKGTQMNNIRGLCLPIALSMSLMSSTMIRQREIEGSLVDRRACGCGDRDDFCPGCMQTTQQMHADEARRSGNRNTK